MNMCTDSHAKHSVHKKITLKNVITGKTIFVDMLLEDHLSVTNVYKDMEKMKTLVKSVVLEKMGLNNFTLFNSSDPNVPLSCYYVNTESVENSTECVHTCGICLQPIIQEQWSNVKVHMHEWKCGHHKLFCSDCIILHKRNECKKYGGFGMKCPLCRGMI